MSNVVAKQEDRLKSLITSEQVKSRFNEILGSRAQLLCLAFYRR